MKGTLWASRFLYRAQHSKRHRHRAPDKSAALRPPSGRPPAATPGRRCACQSDCDCSNNAIRAAEARTATRTALCPSHLLPFKTTRIRTAARPSPANYVDSDSPPLRHHRPVLSPTHPPVCNSTPEQSFDRNTS
ncbi:unnamed protein product, partial [Iphiclides podalirius]